MRTYYLFVNTVNYTMKCLPTSSPAEFRNVCISSFIMINIDTYRKTECFFIKTYTSHITRLFVENFPNFLSIKSSIQTPKCHSFPLRCTDLLKNNTTSGLYQCNHTPLHHIKTLNSSQERIRPIRSLNWIEKRRERASFLSLSGPVSTGRWGMQYTPTEIPSS